MNTREVARIAARDLSGAPPPRVTEDLPAGVGGAGSAVRFSRRALDARLGAPVVVDPDGTRRPGRFVRDGMGKLGALELNFSSDIDYRLTSTKRTRGDRRAARSVSPTSISSVWGKRSHGSFRKPRRTGSSSGGPALGAPRGRAGARELLRSAEIYYESWGQTWGALRSSRRARGGGPLPRGEVPPVVGPLRLPQVPRSRRSRRSRG